MNEGNTVAHWVQWVGFVHRLTFPKINGSVLVSCHQRPVAHLWKVHWNFTLIILFEVSDGFERKLCGRKAGLQKKPYKLLINISRCVISMKEKKLKYYIILIIIFQNNILKHFFCVCDRNCLSWIAWIKYQVHAVCFTIWLLTTWMA